MEAYCMRCKAKREMANPHPVYSKKGRPGTRGTCPVCGSGMFRMGKTEHHESLPKPKVAPGDGKLVIVESPAKARTMGKFLGKGYKVEATVGHVRDLLKSRLSVDVENDFTPTYRVLKEKRKTVNHLQKMAKKAAEVYLATDPDREGEAIAWHVAEAAKIEDRPIYRVVFHEITESAIREAFANHRDIDMKLVNAQQARRILDRLVGYQISPLLWKSVRGGLSAGRVQSVAVRLVVEREREIEAFVPVEYWSIEAELAKQETRGQEDREGFWAKLHKVRGEKVDLSNQKEAEKIVDDLQGASYVVAKVVKRDRRRKPPTPFITSTLQQDASRRLRFSARRTMRIAQQLYEGIDVGPEGSVGLITYMRTDSVNVSAQAQAEARDYVTEKYGDKYLPSKPPRHKTRAKRAEEAHEAIRPTSVRREPQVMRQYLSPEQFGLYDLIWSRFLASQMAPAVVETTAIDIEAGDPWVEMPYLFRVTISVVKFPGFLRVYGDVRKDKEEQIAPLPALAQSEMLDLLRLVPKQHFTKPPPRYSEATLVRALEEHGIGRPSTYAPTLSTIQGRGYVQLTDRRFQPTELGFIVNDLLVGHFGEIINVGFTARMEENLDLIASGEREWVPVLRRFYDRFEGQLEKAKVEMEKVKLEPEPAGIDCDKCGSPMVIKMGRYGKFIACSNYPKCRNTKPFLVKVGVTCPECGGDLIEKKTRKGRVFYGCSNYPECKFASWDKPVPEPCPECGGLMVEAGKDSIKCIRCGARRERLPDETTIQEEPLES
ncbi:MAG: DNA topoisomerase I [Chloroflexi bacterium B3_Chlor]|nr:MAG: DNA topoisomerase I [Chloroflexi bacterium B3_Chlor]